MTKSAWERVQMARDPKRLKAMDVIRYLTDTFIEFHGDRCFGDDGAIIGGIGTMAEMPVTILAQAKRPRKTFKEILGCQVLKGIAK